MKEKIDALVVVEGKSDTQRLQQYYDVETFETSGMGLNEEMLQVLEKIAQKREIVVFTDPDMPGEHIRKKIVERIPNVQHVLINKKEAESKNKKKIGVEHADKEALDTAFSKMHKISQKGNEDFILFNQVDMIDYGFVGLPDSKKRRDFVASELHLGTINAKQFLKRLNLFFISRDDIELVLNKYERREKL